MGERAPGTIRAKWVQMRQPSWLRTLGGLAMVVGVMLLVPTLAGHLVPALAVAGLLSLALGALPAVASRRDRGGELVLEPEGVRVRGAKRDSLVLREQVEDGYESPGTHEVVLRLKGGTEMIAELSGDRGEDVLEHMGVGLHQRVLTAPLRGLLGAFTKGLLTVLAGAVFLFGPLIGAFPGMGVIYAVVLTSALTAFVVTRFGKPRVVVGIDGVRLVGGLRQRFVPYGRVKGVSTLSWYKGHTTGPDDAQGIALTVEDAAPIILPTIGQSRAQVDALIHRIRQGMAAAEGSDGFPLGALERQGRPIQAWRDDLRRLALASGGFRDQAMTREGFESVLDDPRAPADQRVGAAFALRSLDAAGAPARIRIAAEASANDKLRIALEAAGADEVDDSAIEEALRTPAGP